MSQHYPRLSPSGDAWCAGDTRVYIDGVEVGIGRTPQWQGDQTIIALAPEVGVLRYRLQASGLWAQDWLDREARANALAVSAAGWAYVTTVPSPRVITWDERTFDGYSAVAVAPDGRLALGNHADGSLWVLDHPRAEPRLLVPHACRDLRWTDAGLTFTVDTGQPQVWTCYDGKTPMPTSVTAPEYAASVAKGPNGLRWVLSLDAARLLLRVDSNVTGYVLATQADTFSPDVQWQPSRQRFRVVWATKRGEFREREVDPATDRVDLRLAPAPQPQPTPQPNPPPPPEPPVTDYKDFAWDACDIERGVEDIGTWRIATWLQSARVPPLKESGFKFSWENHGWPETTVPDVGPGLVGNVWLIAKIGNRWNAATFDWLRFPNQGEKGESCETARDDQIRAGAWLRWQPQNGDVVGLMVSCPARSAHRTKLERSAIAWTRIGTAGILAHEGAAPAPQPEPTPQPPPPPPTPNPPPPSPDLTAILAAIERLATAQAGMIARQEQHTAILAEWMVDLSGHLGAIGDTADAIMADLQVPRDVTVSGHVLRQRITMSGSVRKPDA